MKMLVTGRAARYGGDLKRGRRYYDVEAVELKLNHSDIVLSETVSFCFSNSGIFFASYVEQSLLRKHDVRSSNITGASLGYGCGNDGIIYIAEISVLTAPEKPARRGTFVTIESARVRR